ncbi:MAG: universal stress protein [Alphaproteobacteria bacterium]|nr:universal stress protein [Alphaproteobacteria bacterium]
MFKEILLAIDLEDKNSWEKALPFSVSYAQAFDAKLHILTVLPDFGMSLVGQYFPADYEEKMRKKSNKALHEFVNIHVPENVTVQNIVATGSVYETIVNMAEEIKADLIVLGAHRPELKDYLIGPNASRVVRHGHCSVLVIRDA